MRLCPIAMQEFVKVRDGTDQLSRQRLTHLRRSFREFCDVHPHRLPPEKFKKEGDFPDGLGGTVAVFAFKAWQWRLYGAVLNVAGRRCFVGMRVDPEKKQDRANQSLLRATATDIAGLHEHRPET